MDKLKLDSIFVSPPIVSVTVGRFGKKWAWIIALLTHFPQKIFRKSTC